MKAYGLFLVMWCCLNITDAAAESFDGNTIYRACETTNDEVMQGFCFGYIFGAVEGMKWGALVGIAALSTEGNFDASKSDVMSSVALGFCIPPTVENGQVSDIVVNYLGDNPESRHESARTLINEALSAAFPCN